MLIQESSHSTPHETLFVEWERFAWKFTQWCAYANKSQWWHIAPKIISDRGSLGVRECYGGRSTGLEQAVALWSASGISASVMRSAHKSVTGGVPRAVRHAPLAADDVGGAAAAAVLADSRYHLNCLTSHDRLQTHLHRWQYDKTRASHMSSMHFLVETSSQVSTTCLYKILYD